MLDINNKLYFTAIPEWHWPLPFSSSVLLDLFLDRFMGINPLQNNSERHIFINLLSKSFSLDVDEKKRVLHEYRILSQFQLDKLERVFIEETGKFQELQKEHPDDIAKLVVRTIIEWGHQINPDTSDLYFIDVFVINNDISASDSWLVFETAMNVLRRYSLYTGLNFITKLILDNTEYLESSQDKREVAFQYVNSAIKIGKIREVDSKGYTDALELSKSFNNDVQLLNIMLIEKHGYKDNESLNSLIPYKNYSNGDNYTLSYIYLSTANLLGKRLIPLKIGLNSIRDTINANSDIAGYTKGIAHQISSNLGNATLLFIRAAILIEIHGDEKLKDYLQYLIKKIYLELKENIFRQTFSKDQIITLITLASISRNTGFINFITSSSTNPSSLESVLMNEVTFNMFGLETINSITSILKRTNLITTSVSDVIYIYLLTVVFAKKHYRDRAYFEATLAHIVRSLTQVCAVHKYDLTVDFVLSASISFHEKQGVKLLHKYIHPEYLEYIQNLDENTKIK